MAWMVLSVRICRSERSGSAITANSIRDIAVLRIRRVIGARINWLDLNHATLPDEERTETDLCTGDVWSAAANGDPRFVVHRAMYEEGGTAAIRRLSYPGVRGCRAAGRVRRQPFQP
jgi:hypothetical protein